MYKHLNQVGERKLYKYLAANVKDFENQCFDDWIGVAEAAAMTAGKGSISIELSADESIYNRPDVLKLERNWFE